MKKATRWKNYRARQKPNLADAALIWYAARSLSTAPMGLADNYLAREVRKALRARTRRKEAR